MKIKKPNYKKWLMKAAWTPWEAVCLFAEINPPKTFDEYVKMKNLIPKLKAKEQECEEKGMFRDLNLVSPSMFN